MSIRETKMVIVIDDSLGMRKGKGMAQAAHAACHFLHDLIDRGEDYTEVQELWSHRDHQSKVVLAVSSHDDLILLYEQAKRSGITVHMVTDAGKTEFHGVPTQTCIAIGPDYKDLIDPLTGKETELFRSKRLRTY
jgi:PTH2 family peptidyl-tRNA hydrolase